MNLKQVDLVKLSKITSQHVDQITCLECCKYYIAPETAVCGHTLCHNCWSGRRTCPVCAKPFERRSLRVNIPLQILSDHILTLKEAFQKLFHVKLDEFLLDTVTDVESENDPTKNVKDWLASSQNQFSAPAQSSERSSQELQQNSNSLEVSSSKIQIHSNTKKTKSPEKVVVVSVPQDDWDKIEPLPDTEDVIKNKENVIGPMDIEPFCFEENEYTSNNPRRSLRNRDGNGDEKSVIKPKNNNSVDSHSLKDSSGETDKRSSKTKQNWNNVKRMRKEFSKLNKKKKNKLNVSIEMCKKNQIAVKSVDLPKATPPPIYEIDENTPMFSIPDTEVQNNSKNTKNNDIDLKLTPQNEKPNVNTVTQIIQSKTVLDIEPKINTSKAMSPIKSPKDTNCPIDTTKMHFYKRSALNPNKPVTNSPKIVNQNVYANAEHSDEDIQITIRVGTSVTNIYIKKKNETEVKVNSDMGVQTSFTADKDGPNSMEINQLDSQKTNVNIVTNTNNNVHVEHHSIPNIEKPKIQNTNSVKSASGKKNTDSADTVTAQFEITESVEKELSNIMEHAENEQNKPTSINITSKNKDIPVPNSEDLEYLNDIDIFESDSVKEQNVQLLKSSNHAPSEILIATAHSKNKTQRSNKRNRVVDSENSNPKKIKLNNTQKIINESIEKGCDTNVLDSEQMNYDSVMGKVFANIDADMKEIDHENNSSGKDNMEIEKPQNNDYGNQKESENVFSVCIVDKDEDNVSTLVPTTCKEPIISEPNAEDFLTPVVCRQTIADSPENVDDIEVINDDSESVVEETPQKNTSLPKINSKQKSNAGVRELNESQITTTTKKSITKDNSKAIVNLADNTSTDSKVSKDITILEAAKRITLETPLTINKFVDHIQHKSTPVARKSLNFDNCDDENDPEQTLCPTSEQIASTTQEKEFLRKAFEKTPVSLARPDKTQMKVKKLCIAGSCLSQSETVKLRLLCKKHNFNYVDRFTPDLTHLVVGVDEENKSQRSVKFMCALAASKWIISFEWVEKCLEANNIVEEERFEVLDSTGEPGPMRSRLAKKKLFNNILFYCFGPFSVLDENTLKMMLESAGGQVVKQVEEIKITGKKGPALLLAEPENTQEDRFIYLAMDLNVVPVNYEWVLNCLGSYTLSSIYELLLCPASILNKNIHKWPQELITREDD